MRLAKKYESKSRGFRPPNRARVTCGLNLRTFAPKPALTAPRSTFSCNRSKDLFGTISTQRVRNLSFFPPTKVYITHKKEQFAQNKDGSPNILIDDYGININAWEDAGGIGFKYKDHKFERTASAIKQAIATR